MQEIKAQKYWQFGLRRLTAILWENGVKVSLGMVAL